MIRWKPDYVQTLAAPRRGLRLLRRLRRLRDAAHRLYHAHLCARCRSGNWRWVPMPGAIHHHVRVPNLRIVRRPTTPQPRAARMEEFH